MKITEKREEDNERSQQDNEASNEGLEVRHEDKRRRKMKAGIYR